MTTPHRTAPPWSAGLILTTLAVFAWPLAAAAQPAEGEGGQDNAPPEGDEGVGQPPAPPVQPPTAAAHEATCNDGQDEDGDGMPDCADADCFDDAHCHAGGRSEANNERCSDWIDNDGDGAADCEDSECAADGITVCGGSWRGDSPAGPAPGGRDDIPELTGDMSVEDLIGRAGDEDGERNDFMCSDGVDNDHDGRTDCQDFGCRFDQSVRVCTGAPGTRLSLVVGAGLALDLERLGDDLAGVPAPSTAPPVLDARFTRIQFRALGPIPFIQNSFFLLSFRLERTVRLSFATFQIPVTNSGHYLSINSGSGNLSSGPILSVAKYPLLERAFYLYNRFEHGAGAALEQGGPIDDRFLHYRLFIAGGSGEFSGNVGGRFFRAENRNFAYSGGAQLQIDFAGHYNRFDTQYIYTPLPLTVALLIGAKYDQRPDERFFGYNAQLVFRFWHFLVTAETYQRYVFDFEGFEWAWNATASILLYPRVLMLAADIGGFYATEYAVTTGFTSGFTRPLDELQWRVALHWFWFRNIGILSLLFRQRLIENNPERPEDPTVENELLLETQFRF